MIYTPENAAGALVFDMATGQEIERVLSVDTEKREVIVQAGVPLTLIRTFQRIDANLHPSTRCLVAAHCYGEVKA